MKTIQEFIDNKKYKIWTEMYLADDPKATIIYSNGSGEYRTVSMEDSHAIASWLNKNNYNFLVYDKFGCGKTSGDYETLTIDILVDNLLFVIEHVKEVYNTKIILFGHSEGSLISIEAATKTNLVDAILARVVSHQDICERTKYQIEKFKCFTSFEGWKNGIKNETGFTSNHPNTMWRSRINRKLAGDTLLELNIPVFAQTARKMNQQH